MLCCYSSIAFSQAIINSADLPGMGDTLITWNANFLITPDLTDTGADHSWTFGFDALEPVNLNPGIACHSIEDTPFTYQFLFNDPWLYPDHDSDFGIGVPATSIATFALEDAYQYYRNHGDKYAVTGMGITINGIPIAAQMNDVDIIYDLPLEFGNNGTSHSVLNFDVPDIGYYGVDQIRSYECDGWGTLNIWEQSFEVVRVRSVVNASDSIYTGFIDFGITLPRPESISYEWISTAYNVPVLKITETAGVITQVQTADIYEGSDDISENGADQFFLYPNPSRDELQISGMNISNAAMHIYSINGELVLACTMQNSSVIDVHDLAAGLYCAEIISNGKSARKIFVKE